MSTLQRTSHPRFLVSLACLGLLFASTLVAASAASAQATPAPFQVTITNITPSQIFGPPLVISHSRDFSLFTVGQPASPGVAEMAEEATLGTLMAELEAHPGVFDFAAASGPLMPGHSVTLEVDSLFPFDHVSAVQMLVTTNDAFFAVESVGPRGPRQRRLVLLGNAYDAGSEINSESCATVPGPPCGSGGVHDPAPAEGFVHIHPGIHGVGDLPAADFDWRNPVVKVEVVRLPPQG